MHSTRSSSSGTSKLTSTCSSRRASQAVRSNMIDATASATAGGRTSAAHDPTPGEAPAAFWSASFRTTRADVYGASPGS